MSKNAKSKYWFITLNVDPCLPESLEGGWRYVTGQTEEGEEKGREHTHLYIETKSPVRWGTMEKRYKARGDVQIARDPDAVIKYCTKEEGRIEGPIEFGKRATQGQRNDLVAAKDAIVAGMRRSEFRDKFTTVFGRYNHFYDDVRETVEPEKKPREVHLYYGDTDTGKTHQARMGHEDCYVTPIQHGFWFNRYDDQEVVIMDDFTGECRLRDLKRVLHDWPELVEKKGGFLWFNPSKIIITSNQHPRQWYKWERHSAKDKAALMRRFTSITIFTANEEPVTLEDRESVLEWLGYTLDLKEIAKVFEWTGASPFDDDHCPPHAKVSNKRKYIVV